MEENPENNGNRTIRSTEEVMDVFLKVYNNEVDINNKDIDLYEKLKRVYSGENVGVNRSYVKEEKGENVRPVT